MFNISSNSKTVKDITSGKCFKSLKKLNSRTKIRRSFSNASTLKKRTLDSVYSRESYGRNT